ncbi:hypothetical protein FQA39_LY08419 [Lamprigera yunnana]|nr:hypothetical protein FQA39_LY08419 [Lamprigera yunnana]
MSDILITTYTFHNRQYLVKMSNDKCLELVLTDKQTGEEWESTFDVAYIEKLTRKTGNFKQFHIFATMLKSGLLKVTTECITLDLFTYKDLELMSLRKVKSNSKVNRNLNNNRRYLILTYSVEFDKINYPLPLEYCGLPDPTILQATIRKLESELKLAHKELNSHDSNSSDKKYIRTLEKRINDLIVENVDLCKEVKYLTNLPNKSPKGEVETLQKAITKLEKSIKYERNFHHKLVEKLQNDKEELANQLERSKRNERMLKQKLQNFNQGNLNVKNRSETNFVINRENELRKKISKTSDVYDVKRRSRSASPRIIHVDNRQNLTNKYLRNRSQSQSRSSSISNRKDSSSHVLPTPSNSARHSRDTSSHSAHDSATSTSCNFGSKNVPRRYQSSKSIAKLKPQQTRISRILKSYL